jgi:FAD dependent oxidoreductase TIGR03364
VEAIDRGLSVAVIERDERAKGASIRNFGHGYASAQSGDAAIYAHEARRRWLALADAAGFWARETGTLLVARLHEELDVIHEFAVDAASRARVLSSSDAQALAPIAGDALGALWTPSDFRVDPREAIPALTEWLATSQQVAFSWNTTVSGIERGRVSTSRGEYEADAIVIAVGHDLDRLLPETAESAQIERCTLQMLQVASPHTRPIEPALATGLALLRYSGFATCPSLPALRAKIEAERPELLQHEVNLLVTELPTGNLIVGDTHVYGPSSMPFREEQLDALLIDEAARLLGVPTLSVLERWQGVYAHSRGREFLVEMVTPGVLAVAVTSGIGMTTALGLAPRVLDELLV